MDDALLIKRVNGKTDWNTIRRLRSNIDKKLPIAARCFEVSGVSGQVSGCDDAPS